MDSVPCGVQAVTISPGVSRMLRASVLEVLDRTLEEIARNNRITAATVTDGLRDLWESCLYPEFTPVDDPT